MYKIIDISYTYTYKHNYDKQFNLYSKAKYNQGEIGQHNSIKNYISLKYIYIYKTECVSVCLCVCVFHSTEFVL